MSQNTIVGTDILLEFLEIAFHSLLYYRNLYPEEIFKRKKIYGISVYISQHPELNEYIKHILISIKDLIKLNKNCIKFLNLINFNEKNVPVEKFVFQFEQLQEDILTKPDPYFIKTEEALRALYLKLSGLATYLDPLPENSSFTINIVTNEATHTAFLENTKSDSFFWISEENPKELENGQLLPIKHLKTDYLTLQCYAVEDKQSKVDNKKFFYESMADITNISNKLAKGLLSNYEKPVENIKQELNNLKSKQEKCIMQLQLENKKLCDAQEDIELHDLFATVELYQKRLMNIKKEIIIIHDRTLKLKKRATRFQQIKQKEIVHKEQFEQD